MKLFISGLLAFSTGLALANCAEKAQNAALHAALSPRQLHNPAFGWDLTVVSTTRAPRSVTYVVEVRTSYNDGSSTDEFEPENYRVRASGTESSCRILGVDKL